MNKAGGGPSGLAGIQVQTRLWESEWKSGFSLLKQHSWAEMVLKSLSVRAWGKVLEKKNPTKIVQRTYLFSSLCPNTEPCIFSPTTILGFLTPDTLR